MSSLLKYIFVGFSECFSCFLSRVWFIALLFSLFTTDSSFAVVFVANNSVVTFCAEDDNVNIPFFGDTNEYIIKAVHPNYPVTTFECPSDFNNCEQTSSTDFEFEPGSDKMYDLSGWVLVAYRRKSFWRPQGMTVSIKDSSRTFTDAHYIAVSKKVSGESSWPQFLVLYADGNLRLIPHPPAGQRSVCFGASVIVGPSEPAERPLSEIGEVEFDPSTKTLITRYANGGTSELAMMVDRTSASVHVKNNFKTGYLPFATFRSMFVEDNNCDTSKVTVLSRGDTVFIHRVLDAFVCSGDTFIFSRTIPSIHNMSAPDIIISIVDPNTTQ